MMWSYTLNGLVGFIVLVSFVFAVPNVADILDPDKNTTGFAAFYVFQECAGKGGIPLMLLLMLVSTASATDATASTARQAFAFARDHGLPFRNWFVKVPCSPLVVRA